MLAYDFVAYEHHKPSSTANRQRHRTFRTLRDYSQNMLVFGFCYLICLRIVVEKNIIEKNWLPACKGLSRWVLTIRIKQHNTTQHNTTPETHHNTYKNLLRDSSPTEHIRINIYTQTQTQNQERLLHHKRDMHSNSKIQKDIKKKTSAASPVLFPQKQKRRQASNTKTWLDTYINRSVCCLRFCWYTI